ncbi:cob(I)yrinic acid a,c-diamide adenosyltransferase [soil metagenome]
MKIYTRKGDKGQTSLIGGTRVSKHHIRIESYGTVDELNSWLGVIRDQANDEAVRTLLKEIQDRLFTVGSSLAADPEHSKMILPDLKAEDIELLEMDMDRMNEVLPELKNFILPGGHLTASYCHVARCVCRRAERLIVELAGQDTVDELVIQYMNRLSDHLFVLSRYLAHKDGAEEISWNPRKA